MIIDIGTIPKADSISKLAFYMDLPGNEDVGGVAGEIEVFKPDFEKDKDKTRWNRIELISLFLAQYIEYKLSHFIDKAFESCFGFISVLPGAFSLF